MGAINPLVENQAQTGCTFGLDRRNQLTNRRTNLPDDYALCVGTQPFLRQQVKPNETQDTQVLLQLVRPQQKQRTN